MNLFILKKEPIVYPDEFVTFWRQFYDDSYKTGYDQVVNKLTWESSDIHLLFEWKNNMSDKLSVSKEKFV